MSKHRKGFTVDRDGKVYVRISYTDQLGNRRELMRRAKDKKHALQLRQELTKQLSTAKQRESLEADRISFKAIAERYKAERLIPAQYIGERKVAGRRSLANPLIWIGRLIAYFGKARLRSITHSQIDQYRLKRLSDGLSIATTNRELELLRAILNFAKREGLLDRTPFEMGEPLIHKADETRRDRVMSLEEESRLLAACTEPREHLQGLIIAAVDTGCRRGELLTLKWSDVDLAARVITLRAFNTKTARSRRVPITDRLAAELGRLSAASEGPADALVFGITDNFKRSWATACKLAGVEGLRFHDLRHTAATRLIGAGIPLEETAKILGHTQVNTTFRHYLNTTKDTLDRARTALNALNQDRKAIEATSEKGGAA